MIGGVITPILNLISSSVLVVGIVAALLVINISAALFMFFGFGFVYFVVIQYTKTKLKNNSEIIAKKSTQMVKSLQEGLGGIRDVLIDGTQNFYCELYRDADLPLRQASGSNVFIGGSPRYIIEVIGMILIAVLAYTMTLESEKSTMIMPVLGALALGAQRLLPALQQMYGSYSAIKGSESSLKDVVDLLNQPMPIHTNKTSLDCISFKNEIKLNKVEFRYGKNSPWILKNINLSIIKGDRVGFVGFTGSGKSTLLDIIMGLLKPTNGELLSDQKIINNENIRSWQSHIAHVPQNIYLSDGTIEENIAFGVASEKINHNLIKKVAEQAQISESISQWENGYQTIVGERGVRLSGGQRQRIGIARALYKQADVLIFDEATSALDTDTEQSVMKAIDRLESRLTILIIAHRLTTLKNCDKIIKLEKNNKIRILKYKDL